MKEKAMKAARFLIIGLLIWWLGRLSVPAAVNQAPPQIQEANVQGATAAAKDHFKIDRVIDGDTVELAGGARVRLIGIDAPEVSECFARESTNKTRKLLEGREVVLEKDVSETDRYGRLLRYVFLEGVLINEELVREGYANTYSYPPDVKYQDRITAAQKEARENNRGLWTACSGPTVAGEREPVLPPTKDDGVCQYSCASPDRDCSDFSTHAEAQDFFDCCGFSAGNDPMRLDKASGTGNGRACESLP